MHLFSFMCGKMLFYTTPLPPSAWDLSANKSNNKHSVLWIENVTIITIAAHAAKDFATLENWFSNKLFSFFPLNLWPQMEKPNQVCRNPLFPQKWEISDLDAAQSSSVLKAQLQEGLWNMFVGNCCCYRGGCCILKKKVVLVLSNARLNMSSAIIRI